MIEFLTHNREGLLMLWVFAVWLIWAFFNGAAKLRESDNEEDSCE